MLETWPPERCWLCPGGGHSLGAGRRGRNRGPSPLELLRGTGGGVSAGLASRDQDRSSLGRERESSPSPERKQSWCPLGEGKGRSLIGPPRNELCQALGLAGRGAMLEMPPSRVAAPSIPSELGGTMRPPCCTPTFAVAPQPPRTSGSALFSKKGISFLRSGSQDPRSCFPPLCKHDKSLIFD